MTLGDRLFATLGPLVGGRCFPAGTVHTDVLPRITYADVGGTPLNYVEDTLPDHDLTRVQLSLWASSRNAAELLTRQAEVAMQASPHFTARRIGGPLTVYEDDTQIHGRHQDFNVWHAR